MGGWWKQGINVSNLNVELRPHKQFKMQPKVKSLHNSRKLFQTLHT